MKVILKNNQKSLPINCFAAIIVLLSILIVNYACEENMYNTLDKFATEETVYPAAFDTIYATIGYERVEIDLRKDGRIPAGKMDMSKAKKTVVVYDEDSPTPTVIVIDSVCSYVNVTGLTEPRLYRIKIYTEDEYGSRSIPQEVSVVPYTSYDKEVLVHGILDPTTSLAPNALVMEWPTGLNTIMMEYHGLSYEYVDQDGEKISGTRLKNPRIYSSNLPAGEEVTFNVKYKVLPILDNEVKLLDTIEVDKPFIVQMPTPDQQFIPQELSILRANGINTFTTEVVSDITELTYPMNMTTFADLFFFPNIQILDLTGYGLRGILETYTYSRNNVTSIAGGGAWQKFMMPVDKPALIKAPESLQTLKDMIESGQITKVRYIPKSMGFDFDAFLAPYVESGIVELLTNNHPFFPDRIFIEPQFFVNGTVQTTSFNMNLSYSGEFLPRPGLTDISKFNPNNDIVNGNQVDLHLDQLIQNDGKNIYRGVIVSKNASFFFCLPREWRYDNVKYPYLKFKMFIGCDKSLVSNVGGNNHHIFRAPWIRPMNKVWSSFNDGDYGQEEWSTGTLPPLTDDEIQNTWREYTVNMSGNDGGDNSNRRNRVYVFNIGHEGSATWSYNPNNQIVVYFADIRLCKTAND